MYQINVRLWQLDLIITIVVKYSGSDLCFLNGMDSEAVVPVTCRHQVLVVGWEDKQFVGNFKIMCKRSTNIVPSWPV